MTTEAWTLTVRVRRAVSATSTLTVRFRVFMVPSGKFPSKNASARARAEASCSAMVRPTFSDRAAASAAASQEADSLARTV